MEYYTHFSFVVPLRSEEEVGWVRNVIDQDDLHEFLGMDEDDYLGELQSELQDDLLSEFLRWWIYADGDGDVELVIAVLEKFTAEFDREEPIGFEVALTGSRPAIDAFGGGAAVVYKGHSWYKATWEVLAELVEKAKEELSK